MLMVLPPGVTVSFHMECDTI